MAEDDSETDEIETEQDEQDQGLLDRLKGFFSRS